MAIVSIGSNEVQIGWDPLLLPPSEPGIWGFVLLAIPFHVWILKALVDRWWQDDRLPKIPLDIGWSSVWPQTPITTSRAHNLSSQK